MDGDEIAALKRHTVRGSLTTAVAQGLKFVVKVATQILVARLLVPDDYGLIAMVTPVLSLSQLIGDLGLGTTSLIQQDISDEEMSALLWFSLALNLVLALALILLAPAIAALYREPRVLPIVIVTAGLLPVTGLAVQPTALLNRRMRFTALAVLDVVPPTAALLVGLTLARLDYTYWSLVAAIAAETVVTVLLAWGSARWRPSRPTLRIGRLLRIGGHITGTHLAGYIAQSVDNVLLGVFKGSDALGLYNRGYRLISQPIAQLVIPVSRVAIPLLNRLRGDPARYRNAWSDLLGLMLLAAVPGLLVTMVAALPLVRLLLGAQWEGVAPIFFWLCLGALASLPQAACGWLLVTQDQTKRQMIIGGVVSAITVAAFVAGLPWGAVGVSAAGALSYVTLSLPLYCWAATRHSMVRLPHLLSALLPQGLATGVTMSVLYKVYDGADSWLSLLGLAGLAYALYAAVNLLLPFGVARHVWGRWRRLREVKP